MFRTLRASVIPFRSVRALNVRDEKSVKREIELKHLGNAYFDLSRWTPVLERDKLSSHRVT